GGHPSDKASYERMLMHRRVEQNASILRTETSAETISDSEWNFTHGAGRGCFERCVDRRVRDRRQSDWRLPVLEAHQRDSQHTYRRGVQAATIASDAVC